MLGRSVLPLHLLPLSDLVDERAFSFLFELVFLEAFEPLFVPEDMLDLIFLDVFFHVGDNDVKVGKLGGEWPKADRVEVYHLVAHVLEHSIERQVVVLAQTQLKEGLLGLVRLRLVAQLVVQEATEELNVALLTIDREGFLVLGTLLIVMSDGLGVRLEHAQEDEKGADHHTRASLSRLTVYHNDWLLDIFNVHVPVIAQELQLVILLHSLQEKGRIHAKGEHFLQICHVVIHEGELADGEWLNCALRVLVLRFGAQIVDLHHFVVMVLQELSNVRLSVSVKAFKTFSWETTRDDSIRDVGEVEIVVARLESFLVRGHDRANPVHCTAGAISAR